jgi:hypothetical protein
VEEEVRRLVRRVAGRRRAEHQALLLASAGLPA